MPINSVQGEIFVGREAEQQEFAATLEELAGGSKRGLFGKAQCSKNQPRVFLVHGNGGMGKTELLQRFSRQCAGRKGDVSWVLLNWDDEQDAGRLPEDFSVLLLRLYNAIAKQLGEDVRKHFKAFVATHENFGKFREKVAREQSAAYKKTVTTLGSIGGGLAEKVVPLPGLDKAMSAATDFAVQAFASFLHQSGGSIEDWLRGFLSTDEHRLYISPFDEYAASFLRGLVELSQDRPLVVAQDTYEWISRIGRMESQFYALIVKPAAQQSDTLAFVIAGRDDLGDDYRRSFQFDRGLLRVYALKPLKEEETRSLLNAYGLHPDLGEEIHRKSLGVPLAVNTLAALRKRVDPDEVSSHFPDFEGAESEVIGETTRRFLRYIVETQLDSVEVARKKISDRHCIYALALLRADDSKALSACWGALEGGAPLPFQNVTARRQELRRRNEFLFERNRSPMQKEVRHFVRGHLRQQIRPEAGSFEREIIIQINQAALDYFQGALLERENDLTSLEERTEDAEWRALCLDELNHSLWLDERNALRCLSRHLLEMGNSGTTFLSQLIQTAKEALGDGHRFLRILEGGVRAVSAEPLDGTGALAMWDEIGKRLTGWKLPPQYRALLANHRGRLQAAASDVNTAVSELIQGLEALPSGSEPWLRKKLLEGLNVCAAIETFKTRDYGKAMDIVRAALQQDPENTQSQHIRLLCKMGLQDYEGSHSLLADLISKHPDEMSYRYTRQMLFQVQGRDEDARQELIQIARKRPDFVQDLVLKIIEQAKDQEAMEAISKWGKDVGWNEQWISTFNNLRSTLSPETLAELIGAQFKLIATEDHSPEQILEVRKIYVHHLPGLPEAHIDLGLAYLSAGRKEEALASFEKAQSLAPDNPALFIMPAMALFQRDYRAEAIPYLEKGAQLHPDNPGPTLVIIEYLFEAGRIEEARTRSESAWLAFPGNSILRWLQGQILTASGDLEGGWRIQREAYQSDPELLQRFKQSLLAQLQYSPEKLKEKIKAEFQGEIGEILVDLPPESLARLYCEIIRVKLTAIAPGQLDAKELIPILEELLVQRPDSLMLWTELFDMLDAAGDRVRAIELLEETIRNSPPPKQDVQRLLVARICFKAGELAKTSRYLREVQSPLPAEEYRILADLLSDAGDLVPAVEAYDKSLALEEDEDTARCARFGLFNLAVGRHDRAEAMLRTLISGQSDFADAYANLSEVLYSQGRYEEARTTCKEAMKLIPESPIYLARLARICKAFGKADEAEAYKHQALSALMELDAYNQACALALLEQVEQAVPLLSDVFGKNPGLRAWAKHDPDFRSLHGNAEFRKLIGD